MIDDKSATLAIAAIGFLAARPDRLEAFLAQSGLDPAELRTRIADSDLWRAAVDFLMEDDSLVRDFCRENDISWRALHAARHALETG